ncbi:MAG: hypothetical protein RI917_604 [Actinomycetota bacterium]|jgi:hypothetical protein
MEILIIALYGLLLALVAPFVLPPSDHYGKAVPAAISLVAGSVIWLVLTWLGFSYQQAWIWFAVMLGMPLIGWFGTRYLDKLRQKNEQLRLAAIRSGGKA